MFGKISNSIKINRSANYFKLVTGQKEMRLFLLLAGMVAIMGFLRPDTFFTSQNLFNILRQVSLVTIVAVAQTYIIITGGIDLSVGYTLGLSGIIISTLLDAAFNPVLSILIGIVAGAGIGLANGLIITLIRLPPFIVTIGMSYIARGFAFVITEGFTVRLSNDFISNLANGYVGPIPIMAIIMFFIVAIFAYILNRTPFGMKTKAVGGNIVAAKLSGINTTKHRILVHTIGGALCGLAGFLMVGRLNAGNPNAGANYDVDSIAATVVGGTSMTGGEGNIIGTLLGAVLLGVVRNALVLLKVSMYWQTVVAGAIILIVCSIDYLSNREQS